MAPLVFDDLPQRALVLMGSAPVIYVLEGHPKFGPRFKPLFEAHGAAPGLCRNDDHHCRSACRSVAIGGWGARAALPCPPRIVAQVALDPDIAESAARLRTLLRLKLADAARAASALAIGAAALVTHDLDFSRVRSLRIIS